MGPTQVGHLLAGSILSCKSPSSSPTCVPEIIILGDPVVYRNHQARLFFLKKSEKVQVECLASLSLGLAWEYMQPATIPGSFPGKTKNTIHLPGKCFPWNVCIYCFLPASFFPMWGPLRWAGSKGRELKSLINEKKTMKRAPSCECRV